MRSRRIWAEGNPDGARYRDTAVLGADGPDGQGEPDGEHWNESSEYVLWMALFCGWRCSIDGALSQLKKMLFKGGEFSRNI